MATAPQSAARSDGAGRSLLRLDPPAPPGWVRDALGAEVREGSTIEKQGLRVSSRQSDDLLFVRAELHGAGDQEDAAFRDAATRCYATLGEILRARELRPLRLWNYIPDIHRPSDRGFRRYEVFNAGRHDAYRDWYGSSDFASRLPTASAVGHRGRDLVVHLLAANTNATPVENPRQRPAYRYSTRYGTPSPGFCRALRLERPPASLGDGALCMTAGTASIVGEETRHPGDPSAQLSETFRNLACLSAVAAGEAPGALLDVAPGDDLAAERTRRALARFKELRVYVVRDRDARVIGEAAARAFPGLERLELADADLCRPDLLVEAEGILSCSE